MSKKLYRVTCRGMTYVMAGVPAHGTAYVVSENPDEAYKKVRNALDRLDLGFSQDREMNKVELIAEEIDYPDCCIRLYT